MYVVLYSAGITQTLKTNLGGNDTRPTLTEWHRWPPLIWWHK